MYQIIIVTNDRDSFSSLARQLGAECDCTIGWDESVKKARDTASATPPDLMVIDEEVDGVSQLEIARQIVLTNPMINLAVVSALTPEDFHEASEGLGILAQLPSRPGQEDASKLVEAIRSISSVKNLP